MGYTIQEKQLAIVNGWDKEAEKLSRCIFNALNDRSLNQDEVAEMSNQLIRNFGMFKWQLCYAINNAKYKRVQRIKQRVNDIVMSGSAIFVTLTFTDSVFSSTNEETRKKYVKRYLKENSSIYVANKDFGANKGREHYHAIVSTLSNSINLSPWHQYGAINVQRVRSKSNDLIKVSKYVAKLSNHAIKETASQSRLIYSR